MSLSNKGEEKRIKSKHKSFLTDGFVSERDFLIVVSVGVFFSFVSVALIMILFQKEINPMYLELLDMVAPLIMVIVGAIFSTDVAEIVANRPKREVIKETVITDGSGSETFSETKYNQEVEQLDDDIV